MRQAKISVFVLLALFAMVPSTFAKSEKKSPQIELVRKLYKAFGWEAVMPSEEGDVLVDQPKDVLKAYFEASLVDLLVADRECAKKEGFCKLDKNPIFDAQNLCVHDLEIAPADTGSGVAVQFNLVDGKIDKLVDIKFQMGQTKNGWRILDVVYENGSSLRQILKPEEQPKDEDE